MDCFFHFILGAGSVAYIMYFLKYLSASKIKCLDASKCKRISASGCIVSSGTYCSGRCVVVICWVSYFMFSVYSLPSWSGAQQDGPSEASGWQDGGGQHQEPWTQVSSLTNPAQTVYHSWCQLLPEPLYTQLGDDWPCYHAWNKWAWGQG